MATRASDPPYAALAAAVTGNPASVRVLWDEVQNRMPSIMVRSDISSDFLPEAMEALAGLGMLDDFLTLLVSRGLAAGEVFLEAAATALGHPLGQSPVSMSAAHSDVLTMALEDEQTSEVEANPAPDMLPAEYQTFFPKDAERTYAGFGQAKDRVCQILIDGQPRGTGVLVAPRLVATAAHVVQPLVEEGAEPASYRGREGSLASLELRFPGSIGEGGVGALSKQWLRHYSPPAASELAVPFQVYAANDIADPAGPWDVALIELAEPFRFRGDSAALVNPLAPMFRFRVSVLHCSLPEGATRIATLLSDGDYLGHVSAASRVRMFHDAMTEPGASGAPCFNADWEIIGIHQGGAYDPTRTRKINRAVPVAPWRDLIEDPADDAQVRWLRTIPAIDGAAPQPVIGRRLFQKRIEIAAQLDAREEDRLFVVLGQAGRGKSFSIRMLYHLRERGHVVCALDLNGAVGLDATRFGARLLNALGDTEREALPPGLSNSDREVLTVTLADVLARIGKVAPDRPLWLALDGLDSAELVEGSGVPQFIDGLVAALASQPRLRLVLTDWTRPLPRGTATAVSNLDDFIEWPTVDDFVDYYELLAFPAGERMPEALRPGLNEAFRALIGPQLNVLAAPPPTLWADILAAAKPLLPAG